MANDKYYRSNGKSYCVRQFSDGTCKVWDGSNKLIGSDIKSLSDAFSLIKAHSGGSDIQQR